MYKKITVVEINDINLYPPTQNLVKILLHKGYSVNLICANVSKISNDISDNLRCKLIEIPSLNTNSKLERWKNRFINHFLVNKLIDESMNDSDILWLTSMNTVRTAGVKAEKYKTIMQFMELARYGYSFHTLIKFPVDKLARKAWKLVVPEENRAYIQKIWWNLDKVPYVLPNKPYDNNPGELTDEAKHAVERMRLETRKIILYLGGIYPDRNFDAYAKAVSNLNDYVLYIIGPASKDSLIMIDDLRRKYPVEYLGAFNPPMHLAFVKYAYMGLLPYKPVFSKVLSELNALYCAPNKIYEYAGFGIPMIGSDVLGLKIAFEKYNMGICCDDSNEKSIYDAISFVDKNHHEMSKNALEFYNNTDLETIVSNILEE